MLPSPFPKALLRNRIQSSRTLLILSALSLGFASARAEKTLPYNGGFEEDLRGWESKDEMSKTTAEAAKDGKLGLVVTDEDESAGSSLHSSRYTVSAGQKIEVSFDAKTGDTFLGVYIWPVDDFGRLIKASESGDLVSARVEPSSDWEHYTVSQVMPEGAAEVCIWVHSWSSAVGTASLDNFKITGVTPNAAQ